MHKIAIAAVALAVFAAPALTGGAKATPLAVGVQAYVAGAQSAAPASTVVPVRHYYRYGHHSFGYGGGFRGHRSFGHGRSFHGHRSFRGGQSHYRGGGFGGSRSHGYGRGGYRGGRGGYGGGRY